MSPERELKRYLKALVSTVEQAIAAIDREMQGPGTPERGRRIAAITNALEMEKDRAKHFGLGLKL